MDAKGSDENVRIMKAIAALSGRADGAEGLRAAGVEPAARLQPHLQHGVRAAAGRGHGDDAGGDPVAVAERVFSVLPLGDNEYYNTQAQVVFVNVCRVLHGMVDEAGNGLVFTHA